MTYQEAAGQRLLMELRAREAWSQRDYITAQNLAQELAASALADSDDLGWWNATFLVAETLRKQGLMQESRAVAETLAGHALTVESQALSARVSTILSLALQGCGDLTAAVTAAQQAVDDASGEVDDVGVLVGARNALIAALADSDQLDSAWQECQALDALLRSEPLSQTTGVGYWAIGNVAFLLKHIPQGVEYHGRAAKALSPTNDLDLWARFNRASASLRLTAGVIEPETLECIERAELASSIVGGSERDCLELSLTRAQWLVLTGQVEASVTLLRSIVEKKRLLATHMAAQAHFLLGQALSAHGGDSGAISNLEASEGLFLQSGAEDSASTARALIDSIRS
ncbi:hypothetical protein [Arthrobacter sp. L77]|uniref:hypothetical protein n=1 Tax=Arthrobacter sp. L77 TaxID=1496689 RepID=UPI0005BC8A71|nr:hypothetical protein [Arthrobacter sp. L77]